MGLGRVALAMDSVAEKHELYQMQLRASTIHPAHDIASL